MYQALDLSLGISGIGGNNVCEHNKQKSRCKELYSVYQALDLSLGISGIDGNSICYHLYN